MRKGIAFRPFEVIAADTLTAPDESRGICEVRLITFALHNPAEPLGFGQPGTNVKISPSGCTSRTYSICSDPEMTGQFQIAVKVYPQGRVSGHLAGLSPGDHARVSRTLTRPVPHFVEGWSIGLIAYGIGITEVLHTARHVLTHGAKAVTLVWGNRYREQLVFDEEIQELLSDFPTFSIRHCISKMTHCSSKDDNAVELASPATHVRWTPGRIGATAIEQEFAEWPEAKSSFLVVGSREMMLAGWGLLSAHGFDRNLTGKANLCDAVCL